MARQKKVIDTTPDIVKSDDDSSNTGVGSDFIHGENYSRDPGAQRRISQDNLETDIEDETTDKE